MCLLIMLARAHPDLPLIVAANRDEQLHRPAVAMTVLREAGPRTLGGRDELAGGTWLAVNEAGVVAGLTNRPTTDGPNPAKRSRGELPLMLTGQTSAAAAVEAFAAEVRPSDYNPAWLLVADRAAAFAIDVNGGEAPVVQPLPPGLHILENRPVGAPSSKVDHVRRLLHGAERLPGAALVPRLQTVLGDHVIPTATAANDEADVRPLPPEVKAACVHTERYGTRSSCVITVPSAPAEPPRVVYADGPACVASYADAGALWLGQRTGSVPSANPSR
jgi:uncharacterized protein with NRDE domain